MPRLKPDVPLLKAPVPRVHHGAPRSRVIRRANASTAADAIGRLSPGCEVFALTNGQFSLVDVLAHAIDTTGPADLDIATWNASGDDLTQAHAFVLDGRVRSVRLIVDPSFRARKPAFCETLVSLFGDQAVRTVPIHAKFAVVRAPNWTLAIRTSMNLNPNRRIETVEISDDPSLCSFLASFVDEVFASHDPATNFTSQSHSLISRHDEASRLTLSKSGKLLF